MNTRPRQLSRKSVSVIDKLIGFIFSSPFVSDALCQETLGYPKHDRSAARRYLELPISLRPPISHFFDREFYEHKYPDAALAELDPFLQFMTVGCAEGRWPHPLVDPAYIRSTDPFVLPDGYGPNELYEVLHFGLVDPSAYFSNEYYRAQISDVVDGLLVHFLTEGIRRGLRPNPLFDPLWYCRQLEGNNDERSGLRHFVLQGDKEGRAPSLEFSSRRYLEGNPDVAEAEVPALAHYLTNGRAEGRPYYPVSANRTRAPASGQPDPAQARIDATDSCAIYRRSRNRFEDVRQEQKDRVRARRPKIVQFSDPTAEIANLKLPRFRRPHVSIIVPIYNGLAYTVECIGALLCSKPQTSYELVVADDASTDGSIELLRKIRNIKIVTQPKNVGFLANCNGAFAIWTGTYVLLLNNDAQLMPGALDALVAVLDSNKEVAAAGPKVLYPDGRLQEAGCMIDRDGVASMTGLFADPGCPQYNRPRDVHYCSGAALLVRRSEINGALFDEAFRPAYCEDADLCLRLLSQGRRVVYCPSAEVVHHLSVSHQSSEKRLQLIVRNQQRLADKWAPLLETLNRARLVAFYLPQYHPTPENNFHWGMGFTEWTNVAKAVPAYVGHYQPHIPADLGFYDLRVRRTVERQTLLARRYGIDGFCVYYYNFGPHRALDGPFEAIVADTTIDFPFCVCWANENWTRRWDGGNEEVIFAQQYDDATQLGVIRDGVRYARDPRYFCVNGKPLFLVYRPLLIPDPPRFAARCRDSFREAGFPDAHLVYVESMETAVSGSQPEAIGFDACVEFPPHGRGVAVDEPRALLRNDFQGIQYDYEAAVIADMRRPPAAYKRYPGVFPSWDNTPRHPLRGDSFIQATPEVFQAYLEEKLDYMRDLFVGDERLLFVNAWNEWAEGTHLEPDMKFGHRWLEAIRNARLTKSLI